MNRYYVEIVCRANSITRAQLEAMFEPIANAVYELTGVIDADLAANFGDLTLEFMMSVDAGDEVRALGASLAATRTALHAAGHSTPGWERIFETIQQTVRKEQPAHA